MDVPLQKKTSYKQHYKTEWERNPNFKPWLKPIPGDSTRAMCNYCKRDFAAKISDIQRHSQSAHHKKQIKPMLEKSQTQIIIPKKPIDDTHRAEATLSMFVAEHTAISIVDHLTELCKRRFSAAPCVEHLKLHRTKCTAIIKEILAPHFMRTLRLDVANNAYSLLIDESTDITVKKCLGVVIKYYSTADCKIKSTFLGLIELESSNAEGIVVGLVKLLQQYRLSLDYLVGIGTDNAIVMTGMNSGVYTILRKKYNLPNLILIRCVCHSIQLAVSHASVETIPRNLEFLLRETYSWFKISSKRQSEYKKIYETINCGEEPLKILKTCDTRWLSIEPAVTRILSQWDELKLHFEITRSNENCYKAELLFSMFNDLRNKIYLTFLRSILDNVQKTIKIFESKTSDPCLLYNTLLDLIKQLCLRVIIAKPGLKFETLNVANEISPSPYLGYLFEKELIKADLNEDEKKGIKKRCMDFIVKLINQLQQRLPENINVLQNSMCLSPSVILKENRLLQNFIDLVEGLGETENIDNVVQEWTTIKLQNWENTENTELFWSEVGKVKDASGECPYKLIHKIAIKVMSLPHSNADIERIFSTMNIVKNKLRNALNVDTINAILQVRMGLISKQSTCFNYDLPDDVLRQIGSNEKYKLGIAQRCVDITEPQPGPSGSGFLQAFPTGDSEDDDSVDDL